MEDSENRKSLYSNPVNDYNVIQTRLDTRDLLERIELFLRGAKQGIVESEDGSIREHKIMLGKPKANDTGVQSILNWVSATVNPHTVQGNFVADKHGQSEMFDNYIEEYHIELATSLVANCYNWEIDDDEIDSIIDFIMLMIIPFMSRLIDNEERKSYNQTLRAVESSTLKQQGGIPLFNRGG